MIFREKGGSVVANRVQRADYRKLTADELPNSSTPMADKQRPVPNESLSSPSAVIFDEKGNLLFPFHCLVTRVVIMLYGDSTFRVIAKLI